MKKNKFFIAVAMLAVGCTTAKMAVDKNNWNNIEEFSVKGRQGLLINQKLSFGEYKTASVKRSWTKGSSSFAGWTTGRPGYEDYSRVIGLEFSKKKQTVRFELTDNAAHESSAFCVTKVKSKDFVLGNNPNSLFNISLDILGVADASENLYWIKLYMKNEIHPWEMVLDAIHSGSRLYRRRSPPRQSEWKSLWCPSIVELPCLRSRPHIRCGSARPGRVRPH